MRIVENQSLAAAVASAERVRRTMCEVGRNDMAEEMAGLIRGVTEQRFVIGVVGAAKRGKSTLINGLLARPNDDCAPIAEFPATNVISIFGRSESPSARVVFADNTVRDVTEREIRLYVTEKHNPGNSKKVRSVEVLGPFAGLETGVFVVDTPGANNALTSTHGEILLEFLPVADAVIFLVTGDEPLTEAEQNLLKAIKGNNTRKVFFAVNKVDRVESGDLDRDELAQGIEHNRRVLAASGFPDAAVYEISARNYFETQSDAGTERLLAAVREMVAKERVLVMVERLHDRARGLLERCHAEMSIALRESKATTQEIEAERKALEATRSALRREKPRRERQFADEWDAAFDELERSLRTVRSELVSEYSQLVDASSSMRVPALSQTVHADVQVSFAERLRPKMERCEARITDATLALEKSVKTVMMNLSPEIAPRATLQSLAKDGVKVGGAAVPALITGTVSAVLPGIVGSLIAGATPAVAAITWNPATWIPWLSSAATATAVGGTGAIVTTALSAVAMPFAIGAFGLAAFRAYSTWRDMKNMQKNELKSKVVAMVEDGCSQVAEQIGNYRKAQSGILLAFDQSIEASIEHADQRLAELLVRRPSPQQIQILEDGVATLHKQLRLLTAPARCAGGGELGSSSLSPLVDDLRSAR